MNFSKIFKFFFIAIFFIGIISPLVATAEVKFCAQTTIPGFGIFTKDICTPVSSVTLANTVAGMYKFIAGIAGIAAVIVMMAGGYVWLFAGGNASKVTEAKSLITSAVLGLFLVLGSYMILNLINPELIKLKSLDNITGIKSISVGQKAVSEICTSGARNEMIGKLITEKKISDASQVKCGFIGEYKPGSECINVYCPGQNGNLGTTDICLIRSNAEGKFIRGDCASKISARISGTTEGDGSVSVSAYSDNKKCGEITDYSTVGASKIGQLCGITTDPSFNSCYFVNQENKSAELNVWDNTKQPIEYKLEGVNNGKTTYPSCNK